MRTDSRCLVCENEVHSGVRPCPHCGHPDPHETTEPHGEEPASEDKASPADTEPARTATHPDEPPPDSVQQEEGTPPAGSLFTSAWETVAQNWIAILSLALTTALLATAIYLWMMDTRTGVAVLREHGLAMERIRDTAPILALTAMLLSIRIIRWLDFFVMVAALAVLSFLPTWTQAVVLLVPALSARLGSRSENAPSWRQSLVVTVSVSVLVALSLAAVGAIDVGEPTATDYFVSWPVLLHEASPFGLLAIGFGVVCHHQSSRTTSPRRQLIAGGAWLCGGALALVTALLLSPPPCQDYADYLAAACPTECGFDRDLYQEACELKMATGLLTRESARSATGACVEWKITCEDIQREKRRAAVERKIQSGDSSLCRSMVYAREVCEALFGVIEPGPNKAAGRSTSAQRRTVKRYLEDRGYKKIWGYIVARDSPGVYEAAWLRNTSWGPVPTDNHFVLETSMTEYSTKGTFSMWARKTGTRRVSLVSGFADQWDIYEEDPFGSVIQAIWDAPAGYETSEAAREALLGLCMLEGLYE